MARGRYQDEPLPVLWRAYREPMLPQEVPVHRVYLGVLDPLDRGELDGDTDDVVGREISAGQIRRRTPVYHGADELRQELVPTVGSFGGGGETQSVGGEKHLRDHGVLLCRQVVDLVVDDEGEAVAVALGVDVGRVIGRDGERCNLVIASAQESDRNRRTEGIRKDGVPLLQESECRYHDERATSDALDRPHRNSRLSGPGRQHDHAPKLLLTPGVQS